MQRIKPSQTGQRGISLGYSGPNNTGRGIVNTNPAITAEVIRTEQAGYSSAAYNPTTALPAVGGDPRLLTEGFASLYGDFRWPLPNQEAVIVPLTKRSELAGFQPSPVDPRTAIGHVGTLPAAPSGLQKIDRSLGLNTSFSGFGSSGRNKASAQPGPPTPQSSPAQSELAPAA